MTQREIDAALPQQPAANRVAAPVNLNALWIDCVLQALCASGARRAVACPGGRSALMVLAMREHPGFDEVLVCNDERSAAFIALGMAKAAREPVVVVTTSGSALANVVPALTEADACGVPLLIVSCDRPRYLRDSGFGQMIDHIGACRPFVRASLDLPDPNGTAAVFPALRTALDEALALHDGVRAGPVHINLPLAGRHDSSEPQQIPADALDEARKASAYSAPSRCIQPARQPDMNSLCGRLGIRNGVRALVVAGPDSDLPPALLREFVAAAGLPVLADAGSSLRGEGLPNVINGHVALSVAALRYARPPELIVRFGLAPVMPSVQDYLLAHPVPTLRIARSPVTRDFLHPCLEQLTAPSGATLSALAAAFGGGDPIWNAVWQAAARHAQQTLRAAAVRLDWGEQAALQTVFDSDGFNFAHLANSMSVRHADMLYSGRGIAQDIYTNRGVWGIDGTLSTFIGECIVRAAPGLLVLGDLAFLHDLGALASAIHLRTPACVCIVNNNGGAIFDFLPLARLPGYQAAVRNPQRFDAGPMAAAFGLPHRRVQSRAALAAALDAARAHPGVSIVEIVVAAGSARSGAEQLTRALTGGDPGAGATSFTEAE